MTVRPFKVTRQDGRLVGCEYIVKTVSHRAALSCPDTKRITICNTADAGKIVGSLLLSSEPGALAYLGSKIFTVVKGGGVLRLTTADIPVVDDLSERLYCERSTWLTTSGNYLIAPGRIGSLVVLDTGTEVISRLDSVLSRIELAVGNGNRVYCFDGLGKGAVVGIDATTGAVSKISEFTAQDCQGALRGHIHNSALVVAIDQLETVAVFDLTDGDNPARSSRTEYLGTHLNSVLDDDAHLPLTDEFRDDPGLAPFWPIKHGIMVSDQADLFVHGSSGRLTYTTSIQAVDIIATVPAGVHNINTSYDISVVLAAAPTSNHTVTFSEIAPLDIVSGGTLSFTTSNWNTPQLLRVRSASGGEYSIPYTSSADVGGYLTGSVDIIISDAATYDIVAVVPPGLHYVTLPYPISITLAAAPAAGNPHTVVFTAPSGASIYLGGTLAFTSLNWNVPQFVYVIADSPAATKTFTYTVTALYATINGSFNVDFTEAPRVPFISQFDENFEIITEAATVNFDEITTFDSAPFRVVTIDTVP